MHGGFDNESPTVPTDAIIKLDALQVVKTNAVLVEKIETIIGSQGTNITPPGSKPSTPGGSTSPNEPRSPIVGGIVVVNPIIANDIPNQPPNNMENLYNLFLNYLLKPNEWVNSKIGSEGELGDLSRFHFRSDLIIAMVEQAQNIIKT